MNCNYYLKELDGINLRLEQDLKRQEVDPSAKNGDIPLWKQDFEMASRTYINSRDVALDLGLDVSGPNHRFIKSMKEYFKTIKEDKMNEDA